MTYLDTLDIACAACHATYTASERHVCNPLRDSGRAHSYADELPEPRPTIGRDTWRDTARDALKIIALVPVAALCVFAPVVALWFAAGGGL